MDVSARSVAVALPRKRLLAQKILVVEDSFLQADELCAHVQSEGGHVIGPFSTASAAIEAVTLEAPTGALVDIGLVEGPAFDVLDLLLASGIVAVIVSGYERVTLPLDYQHLHFVRKPARGQAVLAALCAALSGQMPPSSGLEIAWGGEPALI